jgi:putative phage-type endonuclease
MSDDDFVNLIQGSDEWKLARLGKVTASRIADVVAKTKNGWGASRANYMAELLVERLTGIPTAGYENDAMKFGTATEPEARMEYNLHTAGPGIQQVGFVPHPTIAMAGCSPDGLIDDDGLVEIKCPNSSTHIETLLGKCVPGKYEKQIQFQFACTGRKWCDFVSYDPRMPELMRLFIKRVDRHQPQIDHLNTAAIGFLIELHNKLLELKELYDD